MTELSDNPAEIGLPFDSYWPNQKDMLSRALALEEGQVLLCESPTGSGKSGVPIGVSFYRPQCTVGVFSRDLQGQFRDSFSSNIVSVVWGMRHYPCTNDDFISEYEYTYGERPTRADCMFATVTERWECPMVFACPYEAAKVQAVGARVKVINYAYLFHANWWRTYCNDLFCDEAHRLPTVIASLISERIAERTRYRNSFPPFPNAIGGTHMALNASLAWLAKCDKILLVRSQRKDVKVANRARAYRRRLKSLAEALASADENEWYIESGRRFGHFQAKPVVPMRYAHKIITPERRSLTLMSATIGDPSVIASELGIDKYDFVTYPHIFPAENRPVFFYEDAPKIKYDSTVADYCYQMELILNILSDHRDHKGVIHTASWKHAEMIAEVLTAKGLEDRVFVPDLKCDRVKEIERFKHSEDGTVAISPSWKEGLDFCDDLARFTIIAKNPFAPWNDPIVKLRRKRKGGLKHYRWQAALEVVQACGRIVRSPTDWGISYLVDGTWPRLQRYAPKWFEVQVI